MRPQIALIVCSNRSDAQFDLIWKNVLLASELKEILLVFQGQGHPVLTEHPKIKVIFSHTKGRGNAINDGLGSVSDEVSIIGLTDDDCILNASWVKEMLFFFHKNPNVDLVFGRTLPYQKKKHLGAFCPSTFHKSKTNIITTQIGIHWQDVGFDNNCAVKKSVFNKIGGYKPWLGPGSVGQGGDDAEFILRALISGHKIGYDDLLIVYHNKWLSQQEIENQSDIYSIGGIAAYFFYGLQGVDKAWEIGMIHIKSCYWIATKDIKKNVIKLQFSTILRRIVAQSYIVLKGLSLAFLFSRLIKIPAKERILP